MKWIRNNKAIEEDLVDYLQNLFDEQMEKNRNLTRVKLQLKENMAKIGLHLGLPWRLVILLDLMMVQCI